MKTDRGNRVWVDGCFDMVHFGHANVVRQAKCLGNYLIAGLHSDAEIIKHKGPPIFTQEERFILLKAIKWVDEVVIDAPYMTQLKVLEKYKCDFCVHGNDISVTQNGQDAYEIVKKAGKYVEVPRTEGISTTDILYRILRAVKNRKSGNFELLNDFNALSCTPRSIYTSGTTHYIPNILRIAQFSSASDGHTLNTLSNGSIDGIRSPKAGERIVYVPGAFDLMHVGHVKFLEKCRELGTYIIVGLHSDKTASLEPGRIGPILNMEERYLSLLAIRYVNNVIRDAPLVITEELIDFFKVDFVAIGMHTDDKPGTKDYPFDIPRKRGIFTKVDSGSDVTTREVIKRIINNNAYATRNQVKEAREAEVITRTSTNTVVGK